MAYILIAICSFIVGVPVGIVIGIVIETDMSNMWIDK